MYCAFLIVSVRFIEVPSPKKKGPKTLDVTQSGAQVVSSSQVDLSLTTDIAQTTLQAFDDVVGARGAR